MTAMEEYISSGKQVQSAPKNCGVILDNTSKKTATLFDEYKLTDIISNLYKDPANSYILFGDMVYIARDSLKGNNASDALLKARKNAIATFELNKKMKKMKRGFMEFGLWSWRGRGIKVIVQILKIESERRKMLFDFVTKAFPDALVEEIILSEEKEPDGWELAIRYKNPEHRSIIIRPRHTLMTDTNIDFLSMFFTGIQTARQLLNDPPLKDKDFQGTILLNNKGVERFLKGEKADPFYLWNDQDLSPLVEGFLDSKKVGRSTLTSFPLLGIIRIDFRPPIPLAWREGMVRRFSSPISWRWKNGVSVFETYSEA
jgi:hypothetical protein